ncbi:MAG: serine/threonine protein kinase [Anaerolineae bacterium]|nr:serine/threonine protein kinase [Anaerolineae bacterium]
MDILSFEEIRPGYQLGKYILLEQIGHGGQAIVWSGVDEIKKSVVAVKLVLCETEDPLLDPNAFDQQAQTVASLVHPHIVPLYHFGVSGRFRYMVTRYITGGSLEDILFDGPLPVPEVLRLASQIVSALEYIHGLRLVHRDIKPSNVLLDTQRNAYLTDFGLARILSQYTQALHTGRGTPAYSPPEQVLSAPLTLRSDIYTLGLVLYEMFAGELPWEGMISLASKQLQAGEVLPDASQVNSELPAKLDDVLRSMTHADPESRPNTAGQALEMVHDALGVPYTPGAQLGIALDDAEKQLDLGQYDGIDALNLLNKGLAVQDVADERIELSLTDFFCIDTVCERSNDILASLGDTARQFMLRAALVHGHRIEPWWLRLPPLDDRLQVCAQTIAIEEVPAVERTVALLLRESDALFKHLKLLPMTVERLLDMATDGADVAFQMDALELLGRIGSQAGQWQETAFTPTADRKLATIALGDGFEAKEAVRLIGQVRSMTATGDLVRAWERDRNPYARSALFTIQEVAGDFPPSVSPIVRWQISGQLGLRQILNRAERLIPSFIMTVLGAILGIAFQVYWTLEMRGLLAIQGARITFDRGLLLGMPVGLGIFVTRLIARRFTILKPIPRILAGTVVGGGIVNLSMVIIYWILFLENPPTGWLSTLGSMLLVLGFAVSAAPSRLSWVVRVLLSFVLVDLGILLPWLLSLGTTLSPMFAYSRDWPIWQVALVSSGAALCLALVAQLTEIPKEA